MDTLRAGCALRLTLDHPTADGQQQEACEGEGVMMTVTGLMVLVSYLLPVINSSLLMYDTFTQT